MIKKSLQDTFSQNSPILICWFVVFLLKTYIFFTNMTLNMFLILIFVFGLFYYLTTYIDKHVQFIWLIPTFIFVLLQITSIVDIIKNFDKGTPLALFIVFFNIIKPHMFIDKQNGFIVDLLVKFTAILLLIQEYVHNKYHVSHMSILNCLYLITTYELRRKNLLLQFLRNFRLQMIIYCSIKLPDLLTSIFSGIYKQVSYAELYEKLKQYVSLLTDFKNNRDTLHEFENILLFAKDINNHLIPPDIVLTILTPLFFLPTVIAFIWIRNTNFFWFILLEIVIRTLHYHNITFKNFQFTKELIFGSTYINVLNKTSEGFDLGIKTVNVTRKALDTYIVCVDYANGIRNEIVIDKLTALGTDLGNVYKTSVNNIKQQATKHPYITGTLLLGGVLSTAYLLRKFKRN